MNMKHESASLPDPFESHEAPSVASIPPDDTARRVLTTSQKLVMSGALVLLLGALLGYGLPALQVVAGAVGILYLACTAFKVFLVHSSLSGANEVSVSPEELAALTDREMPVYTVLVPLYKEAGVLPRLVRSLSRLDYPAGRLEIKLLLEHDDHETIAAARALDLPPFCEITIVPPGEPRGKPRACNHGLASARGELLVIYDAEDQPDPQQLKKALLAFSKSVPGTACVQAKLNYYNHTQNLLTRLFTSEYSMWFDMFLPGLRARDFPIPLGGTSNHFRVEVLRALGGWDAWNVTEDADLGLRLHKRGYRTVILDSTTYEEATSGVHNWVRQRSRWIKGYVQTWLVHMRHPVRLARELGPSGFLGFQLMYLGTFFTLLVNPLLWAMTLVWALGGAGWLDPLFRGPAGALSAVTLYAGNFALIYMMMAGSLRRGHGGLVKYALLSPAYWVLMSVAAWKGTLQLVTRPSFWEKTVHNLFDGEPTAGPEARSVTPMLQRAPATAGGASGALAAPTSGRAARASTADVAAQENRAFGSLGLWVLSFLALAGAGAYALQYGHLYEDAALARLYETTVLARSPSILESWRLSLPPLPTLLLGPFVLFKALPQLLLAPVLLSAAFSAGSLVLLDRIARDFGVGRPLRVLMLVLYQTNALVLASSINGASDAMVLFFVVAALRCLQRLRFHPDGDRHGAYLGGLAALVFLTHYEGIVLGPLVLLAIAAALAGAGRRPGAREGQLIVCATTFGYVVGLWLFIGHLRHVPPRELLSGLAGAGGPHGAAVDAGAALWLSPAALVLSVLMLARAALRRDGFALALGLLLCAPPLARVGLRILGEGAGSESLLLYVFPVSVVAGAYLMSDMASLRRLLVPSLLALSSLVTYLGLQRPASAFQHQRRYADMFLHGASPTGDLAEERRVADSLEEVVFSSQPWARVLTTEATARHVSLLGRHPDAFITERSPHFAAALRAPVGEVSHLLVTDADLEHDPIDQAYPGIARSGAPFLELVLRMPGRGDTGCALYRIVPPDGRRRPPPPPAVAPRWLPDGAFIRAEGTRFVLGPTGDTAPVGPGDGQPAIRPFRFVGANLRAVQGEIDRAQYRRTLAVMAQDGLTVGRVWALGEGTPRSPEWEREQVLFRLGPEEYVEESYRQLDRVLAAARDQGIRLVVTLANHWKDYGGIPMYLEWAGIPEGQRDPELFFTDERVRAMYRAGVEKLLSRVNTVTGVRYVDDPTIFSWELINEANGVDSGAQIRWTREMTDLIKRRDPHHLVGSGMISFQSWEDWVDVNALAEIDYLAIHVYPDEDQYSGWTWRRLQSLFMHVANQAQALDKPAVLQEVGFRRGDEAWEGESASGNTSRTLNAALEAGFAGALVWVYEPYSTERRDAYGIFVDRAPESDPMRSALRAAADRLRSGMPAPSPREGRPWEITTRRPDLHREWQRHDGAQLLEMRPDHYQTTTFRRRGTYRPGKLVHVFGDGGGRFTYRFAAPEGGAAPAAVRIEARLSAESPRSEVLPPDWTAELRVLLDDQEVGRLHLAPDDGMGRVERVQIDRPDLFAALSAGHHSLSFEAPDGPNGRGVCIYGLPASGSELDPGDFTPIRIWYLDRKP